MLFVYPAIFHRENNSFWVEFPDLQGCQTFGDTVNETMEAVQEALTGYLLTLLEEGGPIAPASDVTAIEHDSGSFTTLVGCDINQYKDTKAR